MKSPKAKLKKKAWDLFSKYIRLKYADKEGNVQCVTCGVIRHYKDRMQAGHFIDSRNNTVLFDEKLVWPQCVGCNMFKKGNKVNYTLFMMKQGYSAEELTEMVNKKHKTKKISIFDYMELIEELSDKLVGLDIKRGEA